MRVAIVSDALVQRGGAERVVEAIAATFPDAPVYALLYDANNGPASLRERIITSPLQRLPGASRRHRPLLPLFPAAIASFDLRGFDVIISSHHTVAKGVRRPAGAVHVCYCHTPMRALWERTREELVTLSPPLRPFAAAVFSRLRAWDVATAASVDTFVANSETTRERIKRYYNRDSTVVYPPADLDRFTPGGTESDYYLVASRPVPYKRIDVAVDACAKLRKRLVIAGGTPKNIPPGSNIEVLGHVDDSQLVSLMRGARALLFPQLEDFGLTPVEMMATGRPVIAYGRGGAVETVIDGVTGLLVPEQSAEAFAAAIERFEGMRWDPQAARAQAERFSAGRFRIAIRQIVEQTNDGRSKLLVS